MSKSRFGIGGLAFLAGVLATIVTAYAVVSKKPRTTVGTRDRYDGWDDGLGM
jgi:hypothetical protein